MSPENSDVLHYRRPVLGGAIDWGIIAVSPADRKEANVRH
jgi:hypothetical protein